MGKDKTLKTPPHSHKGTPFSKKMLELETIHHLGWDIATRKGGGAFTYNFLNDFIH